MDDAESESERHSKGKRKHRSSEDGGSRKESKTSKLQDINTESDSASSPPRKKEEP